MAARTKEPTTISTDTDVNEVRVRGRVSADPEQREMPSGDRLWSVRVVVRREPAPHARQSVDTVDCAVWKTALHRSVSSWRAGDVVEVSGAVRRRFYRTGAGVASRVEVEVARARIIRRAAT